jgi:hypothetical protein
MHEKRKSITESFEDAYKEYFFGNSSAASADDRLRALQHQLRFWQNSERYVASVGVTDLHHQGVLETYHQQVSQAIIAWNWDFFREVAQAMEFVEHKELDPLGFVLLAARGLFIRRAPDEITKRDVRRLALRWWAVERLCIRQPHRKKELIPLVFQEAAPSIEREIKNEIEALPVQDWTELFKKTGLKHLRADPGGRPAHGT